MSAPPEEEVVINSMTFDILKRQAMEAIPAKLLNATASVEEYLDYTMVRLTQRVLAAPAEEEVVVDSERVPVDWVSHLILTITGKSVPEGYGWRWKLWRRAKTRLIRTRVKHFRLCPHIEIPGHDAGMFGHMTWMQHVNDDMRQSYFEGRGKKNG